MGVLRISLKRPPAIEVSRVSIADLKLVYAICANKRIQYPHGRSPVAYFGTTEKGIARIAGSVAYWAEDVLGLHGSTLFTFASLRAHQNPA